jgi:hypothetical protein
VASRTEGADTLRITRPTRQIVLMLIILACVIAGGVLVWPMVQPVFLSSPYLNGTIGIVFVVGVLACFWQVFQLFSSVAWIEAVGSGGGGDAMDRPPSLLAAATAISRVRGGRMQVTPASAKSVLDSVGARMEESRDITRYIANLLIFLGLLGTFFGLATTVPAVVETIRSLQPTEGEEGLAVFGRLMDGLEDQLGGMGTAFASSLLGLAGSLVVGFWSCSRAMGRTGSTARWRNGWPRSRASACRRARARAAWTAAPSAPCWITWSTRSRRCRASIPNPRRGARRPTRGFQELTQAVGGLTDRMGFGQIEAVEN